MRACASAGAPSEGIGSMKKLLAVLVLLAGPAAAQDGWSFAVTPYVWVPGIETSLDTDFGRLNSSKSNAATLSDLDFAFMGAVEARRGRFGLIGDLLYAKISEDQDTPFGVLFDGVDVTTQVTAATGYGFYRAYEDDHLFVDVLGGARWYDVKIDVSFDEGLLPGQDAGRAQRLVGRRGRPARPGRLQRALVLDRARRRGRLRFRERLHLAGARDGRLPVQ